MAAGFRSALFLLGLGKSAGVAPRPRTTDTTGALDASKPSPPTGRVFDTYKPPGAKPAQRTSTLEEIALAAASEARVESARRAALVAALIAAAYEDDPYELR